MINNLFFLLGILCGMLLIISTIIFQIYLDKKQLTIRKVENKIRNKLKSNSGVMYAETEEDIAQKKIIKRSNKEEGTKLSDL